MNPHARSSTNSRLRATLLVALLLSSSALLAQGNTRSRPFTIHDTDGDGYLSREEYRVLLELRRARQQQRGRLALQPAPAFEEVDRDRDGKIGEQELTDVLHHKMYRYRRRGSPWR